MEGIGVCVSLVLLYAGIRKGSMPVGEAWLFDDIN